MRPYRRSNVMDFIDKEHEVQTF